MSNEITASEADVQSAQKALRMIRGYGVTVGPDHFLARMFAAQRIEGNTDRYKVVPK